jgi:protein required for attachment to host cells
MTTWVLLADTCRARFFAADKAASPLVEVQDLTFPEARLHEGDLVTDKNGRGNSPSGNAHGFGGDHGAKEESAERFAAQVCSELENARSRGAFKKLYVVAAPGFLGLLRKHQSPNLRQLVVGELDKNLATRDRDAIRKQLPDFL